MRRMTGAENFSFNDAVLQWWASHTGIAIEEWIAKLKALPRSLPPGLPADFLADEVLPRGPQDHRTIAAIVALQDLMARKPWKPKFGAL